MYEIYVLLASSIFWGFLYWIVIIPRTAQLSVQKWKEWSLSDDGQDTLIEVLGSEGGVIEHVAGTTAGVIKSIFEGGFGAVAKKLNQDPKVAMASGMADQLKNMKWYESALLMKIAGQIPELQPLLGLAQGVKQVQEGPQQPQTTPEEAQNL